MVNCKTIQKMIVPFEQDSLSLEEEERFINHLETCDDCREEFEIYYIVAYGLSDDDYSGLDPDYRSLLERYDFKGLVDLKIEKSRKKTEYIRGINRLSRMSFVAVDLSMILSIILFVIIRYF